MKVFNAPDDPNRYVILRTLVEKGELSCADVDDKTSLSRPAISHHYRILENAGLTDVRKEGLHCYMKADMTVLEKFVLNFVKTHLKH